MCTVLVHPIFWVGFHAGCFISAGSLVVFLMRAVGGIYKLQLSDYTSVAVGYFFTKKYLTTKRNARYQVPVCMIQRNVSSQHIIPSARYLASHIQRKTGHETSHENANTCLKTSKRLIINLRYKQPSQKHVTKNNNKTQRPGMKQVQQHYHN